jgi:hypothetical protein
VTERGAHSYAKNRQPANPRKSGETHIRLRIVGGVFGRAQMYPLHQARRKQVIPKLPFNLGSLTRYCKLNSLFNTGQPAKRSGVSGPRTVQRDMGAAMVRNSKSAQE